MTLLRRWELVMGHANGFWRKNWACTLSQLHHDKAPSHTSVVTQQFLAKNKMAVIPHPPYSLWFGTLWLLPFSKNEIEAERTPFWYQAESHRVLDTLTEKDFKKRSKNGEDGETGRELLRVWWRPIGLMVSVMIFTASVRNILDTNSCVYTYTHTHVRTHALKFRGLFLSEFFTEWDLLLPLSISSILFVPQDHAVVAYVLFLVFQSLDLSLYLSFINVA
jgi:hypothetical protein